MGMEKSRSTSSGDRGEGSVDRHEENHVIATKISSTLVSDSGDGPSGSMGDRRVSSSKNFEQLGGFSERDGVQGVARAQLNQKVQVTVGVTGACDGNNSSLSKMPCEVLDNGNMRDLKNHPFSNLLRGTMGNLGNDLARDLSQNPLTDLTCGGMGFVGSEDAVSLVGQQAHSEKQDMEVSIPIKPTIDQREKKEAALEYGPRLRWENKDNSPVEKIGKGKRKK